MPRRSGRERIELDTLEHLFEGDAVHFDDDNVVLFAYGSLFCGRDPQQRYVFINRDSNGEKIFEGHFSSRELKVTKYGTLSNSTTSKIVYSNEKNTAAYIALDKLLKEQGI